MRPAAACARSVRADLAGLAQVEAVERLVGEQQRLRRQQADRQQRALALALRQRADRRVRAAAPRSSRCDDLVAQLAARPPKNPSAKSSAQRTVCAGHGAMRVGQVEERRRALARRRSAGRRARASPRRAAARRARHSNSVVLPAPFGPIRPRTSPARTEKRHVAQRRQPAVALGEIPGLKQALISIERGVLTTNGRRDRSLLRVADGHPNNDDNNRADEVLANSIQGSTMATVQHGRRCRRSCPRTRPARSPASSGSRG